MKLKNHISNVHPKPTKSDRVSEGREPLLLNKNVWGWSLLIEMSKGNFNYSQIILAHINMRTTVLYFPWLFSYYCCCDYAKVKIIVLNMCQYKFLWGRKSLIISRSCGRKFYVAWEESHSLPWLTETNCKKNNANTRSHK